MRCRFLIAYLVATAFCADGALAQGRHTTPPASGTQVEISTATIGYAGEFVREERSGNDLYWILRTPSGLTSVPVGAIQSVRVVGSTSSMDVIPKPPIDLKRENTFCLPSLVLRIHGSNTIGAKLAPDLARAMAAECGLTAALSKPTTIPEEVDWEFSKAETDSKYVFSFKAHGSGTAAPNLIAGVADLGMMSRPVNDKEMASAAGAGLGDLKAKGAEHVAALDGLVVIVSGQNPVTSLSLEQIARIFSGELRDWSQVGGAPGPITVYARDARSGTYDTFKSLVLDPGKHKLAPDAKRFESSEELSDGVAADAGGIGFIGFAFVRSAKALQIDTSCGLKFMPDPFGVRTEEYPLSRRLFLYLPPARRAPAAEAFVQFALSDKAQPVVDEAGFIGLSIETSSKEYALERGQYLRILPETRHYSAPDLAQTFARRIAGAARLSVTFRFKTGSAELDNRAVEDLRRLASYVRRNPEAEGRLLLLGFADQRGDFFENRALSNRRAQQVADALATLGARISPANVQGFGVMAPVACSDSEQALEKNRRVEVWLRP